MSDNPFRAPSDLEEPDEDDHLVASQIARRANSNASGALGLAVLGMAASGVALSGIALPTMVYGVVSVGPIIAGGVAIAAGVSAFLAFTGHGPGITRAFAGKRLITLSMAGAAIALGALAIALGIAAVVFVDFGTF